MYTQCPECGTAFRVTAEVLRQAAGRVRCGGCGNAFNALDFLSEDKPAAPVPPAHEDGPAGEATEPPRLEADEPPATISAARSAALLKTLDELAGSDIRIEDTGIEWRVLDADDEDDESQALEDAPRRSWRTTRARCAGSSTNHRRPSMSSSRTSRETSMPRRSSNRRRRPGPAERCASTTTRRSPRISISTANPRNPTSLPPSRCARRRTYPTWPRSTSRWASPKTGKTCWAKSTSPLKRASPGMRVSRVRGRAHGRSRA